MTPDRVRELTGWPAEVPEALLLAHLDAARRGIDQMTSARSGADYEDAVAWEAAASASLVLHTFTLQGAARAGRLEGGVEWRFLTPAEAAAYAAACRSMRDACLERLQGPAPSPAGGLWLAAL